MLENFDFEKRKRAGYGIKSLMRQHAIGKQGRNLTYARPGKCPMNINEHAHAIPKPIKFKDLFAPYAQQDPKL